MRPADLPQRHLPEPEDRRSVADQDARLVAAFVREHRTHGRTRTILEDAEHARQRGAQGPKRHRHAGDQPGRRIGVLDHRRQNVVVGLLARGREGLADTSFGLAYGPDGHAYLEDLAKEALRVPSTEVEHPRIIATTLTSRGPKGDAGICLGS